MNQSYPATLRDGRIVWDVGGPPLDLPAEVRVTVTLLEEGVFPERGRNMAAVLERFAASGGPAEFGHPENWQQETRTERRLPGRES